MAMDMGQEIRAQNAQMKKMAGEAGKLLSNYLCLFFSLFSIAQHLQLNTPSHPLSLPLCRLL